MSATETVTVGEVLPKLASVEPANGPFSVSITWAAGQRAGRTDIVDLAPMIFTFKVFKPLRDNPELFRSVRVGEWGASLIWPGNDDLDIGAESVEELAEDVMTNSDFAAFLKRTGFTLDAAAAQLGIARRLVAYYAKDREIPRYIALACRQLEAEIMERPDATDSVDASLHTAPASSFSGWTVGGNGFVTSGSLITVTDHVPLPRKDWVIFHERRLYSGVPSNPRAVKKADVSVHFAGGLYPFSPDLSHRKSEKP